MEEVIEDIVALSSDEYLRSIEEARSDYKEGKVKSLEELPAGRTKATRTTDATHHTVLLIQF